MKKNLFTLVLLLALTSTSLFAQHYYEVTEVRRTTPSSYNGTAYYLDRKIQEHKSNNNGYVGLITRVGYAFNYDALTYGASLVYHFDGLLGLTAGFDGYYISNKKLIGDSTYNSNNYSFPLWDARAGFLIGKYFAFGGLVGKWTLEQPNEIYMSRNMWGPDTSDSKVMYGGFITFILPIGKYVGFNLDFAVTNKTGFNIGGGINLTLPLK